MPVRRLGGRGILSTDQKGDTMPVQLIKMEPNPATAQRVVEAQASIVGMFRALAPAVQKAGEEMGRSFEQMRSQRPVVTS